LISPYPPLKHSKFFRLMRNFSCAKTKKVENALARILSRNFW